VLIVLIIAIKIVHSKVKYVFQSVFLHHDTPIGFRQRAFPLVRCDCSASMSTEELPPVKLSSDPLPTQINGFYCRVCFSKLDPFCSYSEKTFFCPEDMTADGFIQHVVDVVTLRKNPADLVLESKSGDCLYGKIKMLDCKCVRDCLKRDDQKALLYLVEKKNIKQRC
jgi:hypothetical protein